MRCVHEVYACTHSRVLAETDVAGIQETYQCERFAIVSRISSVCAYTHTCTHLHAHTTHAHR